MVFKLNSSDKKGTGRSPAPVGNIWVGENPKINSDGSLTSANGLKQYRFPEPKKSPFSTTGVQSNFKSRELPSGTWQNNGHLNITPAKPFWQIW